METQAHMQLPQNAVGTHTNSTLWALTHVQVVLAGVIQHLPRDAE